MPERAQNSGVETGCPDERGFRRVWRHGESVAQIVPPTASEQLEELLGCLWPFPGRPPKHDLSTWTVTGDWPDLVPVTEAEIDVFERWFGNLFDKLLGPEPLRQTRWGHNHPHRKGGGYRCYACLTKARQGPTACEGMAIPMEKLDDLIASHLEDRLL